MEKTMNLLNCKNIEEIGKLAIEAMRALETLERGSLSDDTKAKSLQGRWFAKAEPKGKKLKITESIDKNGNKEKEMLIERNRTLTCFTKYELSEGTIKVVKKI